MFPLATITYSSGGRPCGRRASIASRARRAASMRARPASACGRNAARRAATGVRSQSGNGSPAATSSAICCGVRPLSAIAAPSAWPTPAPGAASASTRRFGSGTPCASTPSTPHRRATARSTLRVEWRSMKSSMGSTIASASERERTTASRSMRSCMRSSTVQGRRRLSAGRTFGGRRFERRETERNIGRRGDGQDKTFHRGRFGLDATRSLPQNDGPGFGRRYGSPSEVRPPLTWQVPLERVLMKRSIFFLFAAVLFCFCVMTTQAQAQATRTWISGVGDDVNPCSRTAPCKTWPGAISKTADCGEIDALDPGGFGSITITKGVKLDGGGGEAGMIASNLEGCAGGGIKSSTTSGTNRLNIQMSQITRSGIGVQATSNTDGVIHDSMVSNNGSGGVEANGATSLLSVDLSTVSNNQAFGVHATNSGTMRVTNTSIYFNNGTGMLVDTSGQMLTGNNNWLGGNTSGDGSKTGSVTIL